MADVATVSTMSNLGAAFWAAIMTGTITIGLSYLNNRANGKRLQLQHEHEEKLKNKELLRKKLEKLSELLIRYRYETTMNRGYVLSHTCLDIYSLPENWKKIIEDEKAVEYEIRNLLYIYFRESVPDFGKMNMLKKKLYLYESQLIRFSDDQGSHDFESDKNQFDSEVSNFNMERTDLIAKISRHIETI